ncbi:ricin-type beta-trefoil lectin domain protein [Streptomyces mirabilis]|uniref:ricin-type beta-trefoil lectin domain protein n=1 Tax=Streptomyces mirabilis TaxID=68239 RepID=UPI0038289BD5
MTAVTAVLAVTAQMAVAQGVTGYHFDGSIWNPRALPSLPVVSGHALTGSASKVLPKGYKTLGRYKPQAPAWPKAGTSTVALTHAMAVKSAAPSASASARPNASSRPSASASSRPNVSSRPSGAAARRAAAGGQSGSAVPVSGPVKAAGLPVWVGPAPAAKGVRANAARQVMPAQVRVQVATHRQALTAGANGMLVGFQRADGSTGSGTVQVVIDYAALAKAYGGGYGSRLSLFQLPACALTTPSVRACRTRTPLTFTNRATADQLVATLSLGNGAAADNAHAASRAAARAGLTPMDTTSNMSLVGISSANAGSQGDYGATSLSPSGSWQASATGAFTYSYPIQVPAAIGGNAPSVAFSYDSQSVDGETSARNAQATWVGDGWNYQPGFVERSYRHCGSLLKSDGTHVLKGSGDECWAGDNATISYGSHSGQMVPSTKDSSVPGIVAQWKLQGDDGTVVQELSGAQNGLYQGIYYRVLSTDGSMAYFGSDHAPASTAENASPQSGTPSDSSTNSAWGEPVLHPVSGDPCYNSTDDTASQCSSPEGWRWNLDFTVSPTGFVQRYDYTLEENYYDLGGGQAASGSSGTLTKYTRGGVLSKISYGYQLADELAGRTKAAEVDFVTKQRCQTSSSFDCTQAIDDSNATNWPDVPFDLACQSSDTTSLPPGSTSVPAGTCITASPSFWTTLRLDQVVTKVHVIDPSSHADKGLIPVDTYKLGQVYSDAGGTVDPVTGTTVDPKNAGSLQAVMWLQSIQHTGGADSYDGGSTPVTLNQVSFTGTEIDNRVNDSSPAAPPLYRPRIASIQTETGEGVAVEYNSTPCAGLSLSFSGADSNTKSCYPVYWSPPGESQPVQDWFNKVTVHAVYASDLTIAHTYVPGQTKVVPGSAQHVSVYSYSGPAWHRDDSAETDDQYRTWDQFRGYRTVSVQSGDPTTTDALTQITTTYLQGMNGDYQSDGTQRSVKVPDSVGDSVIDSNWLAGTALETDTYTKAGGTVLTKTVTPVTSTTQTASLAQTPWTDWNSTDFPGTTQPTLSTLPPLTSHRGTGTTSRTYALLANGTWRQNQTVTTDDSQGRPSTADATADVTGTSPQEACTTTSYATPGTGNPMMLTYPDQVTKAAGSCATPTTLLSDQQMYYGGDGTLAGIGTFGQVDATGLVTGSRVATSCTTGAYCSGTGENWRTTAAMAHDGAGRTTKTLDAAGNPTSTAYTPAWSKDGGNTNPTTIVSTNPKGWTTTSQLDPLRGLATENVDTNNRVTDITYDALGRRTAVWLPGRSMSANPSSPNKSFSYSVNAGAVPAPGGTITSPGAPTSVTTNTLREDGSYATSINIYDGMLQLRQTQSSPHGASTSGRLISDVFYDSHGWQRLSYGTYSDTNNAPSTTIYAADETTVPSETATVYDGTGRAITQVLYHQGVEQWQHATSYPGADETDTSQIEDATGNVIPNSGGTSTKTFTNALGQTTSTVVQNTDSLVKLTGGQVIPSGTSLSSGAVRLAMQADGNLVIYGAATGKSLWATNTSGNQGAYAQFGTDGNLHVYSSTGASLWTSGLAASTGSVLQLQNDANLVIYNSAGTSSWTSGSYQKASEADATTSYTYTPAGQVASVKDSAKNAWTYQYNLLGQKTQGTDPDTGTSSFGPYDLLGNLEQITDARGQTLSYQYDWDSRPIGTYTGAWSATPSDANRLTEYTYDTLAKGYPTSSVRYVGGKTSGKAYTEAVTGYDTDYRPTGTTLTVPASDGFAAAGQSTAPTSGTVTYTLSASYTPNTGLLNTTTYQADGNLPAETVTYGYWGTGKLNGFGSSISGAPAYLAQTGYDAFGREVQANYQTKASGKQLATTAQYDNTTGALTQTSASLQTLTAALDAVNYRYNQAGKLTAIDDLQNNTTHDTQCFNYNSFNRLTQAWTDTAGLDNSGTTDPTVGDIGGCTNTSPQTSTTAPIKTTSVGGPAPYWQSYTYDLLGDRTNMVNHDTTGNQANDTTQTIAYPGSDGTTAATHPNQATSITSNTPGLGTTSTTPAYTDPAHGNANAGDTTARTSSGPLVTNFTLSTGGKLCVDDASGSTTAENKVQVYTCNSSSSQQWTLAADGTVQLTGKGVCLDTAADATANGTKVVIDTCDHTKPTQTWKPTPSGTLVNLGTPTTSPLCLADPASSATNGTQLIIWTCGPSGQTWTTPGASQGLASPQTFTYDAEGRTSTVTDAGSSGTQSSSYLYDASGNLLEQTTSLNGAAQSRILYLFGGAEQITQAVSSKSWTALRYYSGPDGTTLTRSSSGSLIYQVANGQGTAETAIDASSLNVTRRYFDPYGKPRGTTPSSWVAADENHGFVGKPTDANSGLDLLGARTYDPTQGRFTSPDPVFEAGDPNQMGGYTYAADNPASKSDPSGLCPKDICDGYGQHTGNPNSSSTSSGATSASPPPSTTTTVTTTTTTTTSSSDDGGCHGFWSCLGSAVTDVVTVVVVVVVVVVVAAAAVTCFETVVVAPACVMAAGEAVGAAGGLVGGASCIEMGCAGAGADPIADEPTTTGSTGASVAGEPPAAKAGGGTASSSEETPSSGSAATSTSAGSAAKTASKGSAADDAGATGEATAASAATPSKPTTGTSGTRASGAGERCSFTPSTQVLLAHGKTKAIAAIKPGDKVEAGDPKTGKHKGTRTVQHIWINHDHDLLDLTVRTKSGHTATLHTTANHPFWDDTTHTWVPAGKLKPGHALNTATNGHVYVAVTHPTPGTANRWNLTVQQLHTYYVVAGGIPILVHNTNVACETSPGRQVAYGSTDLNQEALVARALDGNRSNLYAVARWTDSQGGIQTLAVHASSEGHAEQLMIPRLAERGAAPSDVTDLYVEYQPCSGTVNCEGKILPQFTNPEFELTYSFPWNSDPAVQNAARRGLAAAVRDLWPPRT